MRVQIGEIKDYHKIKTSEGDRVCKNKVVVSTLDETNQTYICKVPVSPYNSQSSEFFNEDSIQLGMQVLFHLAKNKMEGEIISFYDTSVEYDTQQVSEEFQDKTLLNMKKFGSSSEHKVFRDGSFSLTSAMTNIFVDTYNSYVKLMMKIYKIALTGVTFTLSEGLMLFHMIQGAGARFFMKVAVDLKKDKYIKFSLGKEVAPLVQGSVNKGDEVSLKLSDVIQVLIENKFLNLKIDPSSFEAEIFKHKLKITPEEIVFEDNKNSKIKVNKSILSVSKGKTGVEITESGNITCLATNNLYVKSKKDAIIEIKNDLYTNSINYYMYHTNLGGYFRSKVNLYSPNTMIQDSWFSVKPKDLKNLLDEYAKVAATSHGNGNNGSPTAPPPSANTLPVKNASHMKLENPIAKTKYVKDINFN